MWLVSLQGDTDTLKMVSDHLEESHVSIYLEDDKFYLRFPEMKILMKFENVRQIIKNHIETINGAVKLALGAYEPINVDETFFQYEDGGRYVSTTFDLKIKTYDNRSVETKKDLLVPISKWIELSKKDEKVKLVFRLLVNDSISWSGLYKIYELIKKDENTDSFASVNKEALKLFSKTANNYNAVGFDARHALDYRHPPKKKMSLNEARDIINMLIKDWIKHKESIQVASEVDDDET